jgi:hypothetical protein
MGSVQARIAPELKAADIAHLTRLDLIDLQQKLEEERGYLRAWAEGLGLVTLGAGLFGLYNFVQAADAALELAKKADPVKKLSGQAESLTEPIYPDPAMPENQIITDFETPYPQRYEESSPEGAIVLVTNDAEVTDLKQGQKRQQKKQVYRGSAWTAVPFLLATGTGAGLIFYVVPRLLRINRSLQLVRAKLRCVEEVRERIQDAQIADYIESKIVQLKAARTQHLAP